VLKNIKQKLKSDKKHLQPLLIPSLLFEDLPQSAQVILSLVVNDPSIFYRVIRFQYLRPVGFLEHIISKLFEYGTTVVCVWANGVVVKKNKVKILLFIKTSYTNFGHSRIEDLDIILIEGTGSEQLRKILIDIIDLIDEFLGAHSSTTDRKLEYQCFIILYQEGEKRYFFKNNIKELIESNQSTQHTLSQTNI